jgi:hypothetical protein
MFAVTKDQVKAVLDRVLTWPAEAQKEAIALFKQSRRSSLVRSNFPKMIARRLSAAPRMFAAVGLRPTKMFERFLVATGAHDGSLH